MSEAPETTPAMAEADLAWCHETVQDVSRTFALTVDVLEEPMSSYICVGYLLCRIADTIEDAERVPPEETAALLERYDRVLDPDDQTTVEEFERAVAPHCPSDPDDDWRLVAEAGRAVRTFEGVPGEVERAVVPPTRELVQGMETFARRHAETAGVRVASESELDEYCYYVAGTVGHLVTNLVDQTAGGVTTSALRRDAEAFGSLLQLVNIAKDVHADYTEENNVYLPATWLDAVGVAQDAVLDGENEAAVASVVERTVAHARSHLDGAESYLRTLGDVDRNTVAAWAIPFLLAVGTLRELEARPRDALTPAGVKLSREEVFAVVAAVGREVDPETVTDLRETVARGEFDPE